MPRRTASAWIALQPGGKEGRRRPAAVRCGEKAAAPVIARPSVPVALFRPDRSSVEDRSRFTPTWRDHERGWIEALGND
jgi:hypothetical protein